MQITKNIYIYRLHIFCVFVAYINTFQLHKNPQFNDDNNIIYESISRISLNKIVNQYILSFYHCIQCSRYILMFISKNILFAKHYLNYLLNTYLLLFLKIINIYIVRAISYSSIYEIY